MAITDILREASELIHADSQLGQPATYTPVAGGPVTITAIEHWDVEAQSAGLGGDIVTDVRYVSVLKSDVALPMKGDTIVIGTATYRVQRRLDERPYHWQLQVRANG